jgi:hypothetical protein
LSSRDYADEVSDPVIAAQLRQIRSHMLETAPTADRRLRWLLEQAPDSPDWELRVIGTLAAHDYPTDHMLVDGSLAEAARRAPLAFLKAMAGRAAQGLALPSGIGELLAALDPTDDRSVASIVLDFTKLDRRASILSVAAGPETVCALIERFLERSSRARTASDRHSQWQTANLIRERIGLTHQHLFLDGVLRIGMTADLDTISDLSRLVTLHGDIDERRAPLVVDGARRAQIISAVRHWAHPGTRQGIDWPTSRALSAAWQCRSSCQIWRGCWLRICRDIKSRGRDVRLPSWAVTLLQARTRQ